MAGGFCTRWRGIGRFWWWGLEWGILGLGTKVLVAESTVLDYTTCSWDSKSLGIWCGGKAEHPSIIPSSLKVI